MSQLKYLFITSLFVLTFTNCQRNIFEDDNPLDGGISNNQSNGWDRIDFETQSVIKNVVASPTELMIITEEEFIRFDQEEQLIENRELSPVGVSLSRPAISDKVFVRLSDDGTGNQALEFHATQNSDSVIKFSLAELKNQADEVFSIEFVQRVLGVFNAEGNQFLLPAKVFQNGEGYAVFYLFQIEMDDTKQGLKTVQFNERIEIKNLSADPSNITNLVNLKYLAGNYYISTKKGGFRITPNGQVTQIFPKSQWVRDFFLWDEKFYMTALGDFDMHESINNGRDWTRLNRRSALKMVSIRDQQIFSHDELGKAFQLGNKDLQTTENIIYSNTIPQNGPNAYNAIEYFGGQYYISVDRLIYMTNEISTY